MCWIAVPYRFLHDKCDHDWVYFLPIPIIGLISPIELKIGERPEKSGSEIGFLGEDPNIDIYHPSIGIWPAYPIQDCWKCAVSVPNFHCFWNFVKTRVFRRENKRDQQKVQFLAVILVPGTASNSQ